MPNTNAPNIQAISTATAKVMHLLEELGCQMYIFAGFGLYLHDLDDVVYDGDIRIFHPDITEVYNFLKERISEYTVSLRGPHAYTGGTYNNHCVEIDAEVSVDVCGSMSVDCDFGTFEFPFTPETFAAAKPISYEGTVFPVTTVEGLLLYYLVLRRGSADGKEDERRIQRILKSEKFSSAKFMSMIADLPHAEVLRALYNERLPKN